MELLLLCSPSPSPPLAQPKFDPLIDPPFSRKGQSLRIVYQVFHSRIIRFDYGMYKLQILESPLDYRLQWMIDKVEATRWANLAEGALGKRVIRLGSSTSEKYEEEQKKPLFRGLAGGYSCAHDRTSATTNDTLQKLKEGIHLLDQSGTRGIAADRYASLLRQCADAKDLSEGKRLHRHIVKSGYDGNRFLGNLLVHMYGNCGSVKDARAAFDRIRKRNVFSWNILIAAYAHNGFVDDARSLFDRMPQRDVVSWNAMIATYAQNGFGKEALELFQRMHLEGVKPDKITFISTLNACAKVVALAQGKRIHASIVDGGFESDVFVGNSLVNLYGKCSSVSDAKRVFDEMPQRSVISWNTMIAAYAQNDQGKEALELFQRMCLEGVRPDLVTFISILDACASLAALAQGRKIHASIVAGGFMSDRVVGNALVNMYGKCGSLDEARCVFDKLSQRDVVSWNAIIAAYAQNGHSKEAFKLFKQMVLERVTPDKVTFISILFACSHAGLLYDGWHYFVSMSKEYDITPSVEHYGCMTDLIGRAGQLEEAEDLLNNVPSELDAVAWMTLLGACRIYGDVKRGERAAEHAIDLRQMNAAPYVLLSSIYTEAGRPDSAEKVRKAMEDRGIRKPAGRSCIEVKNSIHEFLVGDISHPQKEEIYAELQRLSRQLKEAGNMTETKAVLCDVEEEERGHMLYYHSEKLAIAFGLISTPSGAPLHIIKNLRVCSDCHAATKFISKIVGRKIVVRDANRFHHFEQGLCSCGDYW